jgi:3-oxoadipate CoA-transferase beta subunit
VGAKRIWVVMEHNTRDGQARLLERCSYPLTAKACVSRVYTNLAVLEVAPQGFVVRDIIPGLSFEELQARTAAKLHSGLGRRKESP